MFCMKLTLPVTTSITLPFTVGDVIACRGVKLKTVRFSEQRLVLCRCFCLLALQLTFNALYNTFLIV